MDRYIVQNNNVTGQHEQQPQQEQQPTYLLSTSATDMEENQVSYTVIHSGDGSEGADAIEEVSVVEEQPSGDREENGDGATGAASTIDTSQFNDGVGNTTYIIDNNSSNSIDSVRIGNQNFVPVVDSSQLYNIQVTGGAGHSYTIEGVVNSSALTNYIIEGPAYLVEAKQDVTVQPGTSNAPTLYLEQQPQQVASVVANSKQTRKQAKKKTVIATFTANSEEKNSAAPPLVCSLCSAEFTSATALRFHAYHHNPKTRRFTCIGCEANFEKDKEKEEHELQCEFNYSNVRFECMFCELPYTTPKSLRTHENKHRPVKKTKKYKHMCVCIKCNKAFDAIYTLKLHIRKTHNGNAGPDKKKKKKKPKEEDEAIVGQSTSAQVKIEQQQHKMEVHDDNDDQQDDSEGGHFFNLQ